MTMNMKVHYLEIITPNVDVLCRTYSQLNGVEFTAPVAELGNARTTTMPDGGIVGVRAPLADHEEPIIRPYYLVDDIQAAVKAAVASGAELAHPPLEIPGRGTFAIFIQAGVHHGLWQL